jgi:CRISPR-associated endonuclease Csn1
MYVYKTNPNDVICKIIQNRAYEIKELLTSFETIDKKDKEALSEAKQKLDALIHNPLLDNNNKPIRKVKFYQTNLTGFNIRGGLATKEKTFIGFKATLENDKLSYERIDVANYQKIKSQNDSSFKAFKNDIVFFIFADDSYKGGKIVSFLEDKKMASFSNPRFPASIGNQPLSFLTIFNGNPNSHKQHSINKAVGIIKLNLDILGNINTLQTIGNVQSELYSFLKELKNGMESNTSNKTL